MIWSLLLGCGAGTWVVEAWGEAYIEAAIPAEVFADGCAVTYDTFDVALAEAALLDGDGDALGTVPAAALSLTAPGPVDVGAAEVAAGHYTTARFDVAGAPSVRAAGTLTCPTGAATFDWTFTTATAYVCEVDLTIPAGGEGRTQLTIHGDHLWYDGLENPDAEVRGQAVLDADADADGVITQAELDALPVAPLGYEVGQYASVETLGAFVAFLTQTLGHVDGEGHCQVDL